jgi:hypothetical protein
MILVCIVFVVKIYLLKMQLQAHSGSSKLMHVYPFLVAAILVHIVGWNQAEDTVYDFMVPGDYCEKRRGRVGHYIRYI